MRSFMKQRTILRGGILAGMLAVGAGAAQACSSGDADTSPEGQDASDGVPDGSGTSGGGDATSPVVDANAPEKDSGLHDGGEEPSDAAGEASASDASVIDGGSPAIVTCTRTFGDGVKDVVATGVATQRDGSIVVAGGQDGTVDYGGGPLTSAGSVDVFIAKFDNDCNHVFSKRFGDSAAQGPYGLQIDSQDNIVVAGTFQGQIDFGGGPLSAAAGGRSIFVAKFSGSGNLLWAKSFGSSGTNELRGLSIDKNDNLILTGYFDGTLNFGNGTLPGAGIYAASLDPVGDARWAIAPAVTGNVAFNFATGSIVRPDGSLLIFGSAMGTVDFGAGGLSHAERWAWVARYDENLVLQAVYDFENIVLHLFTDGQGLFARGTVAGAANLGTGLLEVKSSDGGTTFPATFYGTWDDDGSKASAVWSFGKRESPYPSLSFVSGAYAVSFGMSVYCVGTVSYRPGFSCSDDEHKFIRYHSDGGFRSIVDHASGPVTVAPTGQYVVAGSRGSSKATPQRLTITKFAP